MKVNMTYSKDYLTKREAFKGFLVTMPVKLRNQWVEKLKTQKQIYGSYFYISHLNPTHGCCAVGALRLADDTYDYSLLFYVTTLNDTYKVTFKTFIKWICESLPVK